MSRLIISLWKLLTACLKSMALHMPVFFCMDGFLHSFPWLTQMKSFLLQEAFSNHHPLFWSEHFQPSWLTLNYQHLLANLFLLPDRTLQGQASYLNRS